MPLIVGISNAEIFNQGWCGALSRLLGAENCIPTKERYFDLMMPLPFLLIAWWAQQATRKNVSAFLILSAVLVAPQLPTGLELLNRQDPRRLELVMPLVAQLPEESCLLLNAPLRDYVRMWTVAGDRLVFYYHDYDNLVAEGQAPDCPQKFLVSAYQELHGSHLEKIETVSHEGYDMWHLYEIVKNTDDTFCPQDIGLEFNDDKLFLLVECEFADCPNGQTQKPPTRWGLIGEDVGSPKEFQRACPNTPLNLEEVNKTHPIPWQ